MKRRNLTNWPELLSPTLLVSCAYFVIIAFPLDGPSYAQTSLKQEQARRLLKQSHDVWSLDREKAKELLDQAITLDPNNAEAYKDRAFIYYPNKCDKAIPDFTEAIRLSGEKDSLLFFSRGQCNNLVGRYQQAIADYTRADILTPGDPDHYSNRASAYSGLKLHELAVADYSLALEFGKRVPPLVIAGQEHPGYYPWSDYFGRGLSFAALKQYDKAIVDLSEALRTSVGARITAMAYFERGRVYGLIADDDQAIADLSESIRLVKKKDLEQNSYPLGSSYYFRGGAYQRKGEPDKAALDFVEACRLGVTKGCSE